MLELPKEFIAKYRRLLGKEADDFLASFQMEADNGFHLNPLKDLRQFASLKRQAPIPWNRENGRYGKIFGESVAFLSGVAYSQEPSAQFVAWVVDAQPGEKILDLAAAPGGKSTQIAADMNNQGLLIANEISFSRAKILSENIERSGITNCIVTNHRPDELAEHFENYFDKILLDAPCSGEGMFRKDPQAIKYWHSDYSSECANRQKEILKSVLSMLRPNGQLIYSTCTFAPEEDEQIVAWLLDNYSELSLLKIRKKDGIEDGRPQWANGNRELKNTARLWPNKIKGEGHFVARLIKSKGKNQKNKVNQLRSNLSRNDSQNLQNTFKENQFDFPIKQIYRFGDYLYLFPENCPEISGLKVLRLGLQIGRLKNKRFLPTHSLALSSLGNKISQTYDLSDYEFRQFIHGDIITNLKGNFVKGWVLMTKQSNGIGIGRYSDKVIKNFYPKGLRKTIHDQPRS
ncbi:RsmF rRNA methyltransferase first C-terminal domain-containing protein [Oenococcus oeni]